MTKVSLQHLPYFVFISLATLIFSLAVILMIEDKNFQFAIQYVLKFEGGYAHDAKDSGGETKFGISKKIYPHLDISQLTLDKAIDIYYQDYWKPQPYKHIQDPKVATKVFDLAVNAGPTFANRLLQRALRSIGHIISEDSVLGPQTLKAVNQSDTQLLLTALKSEAAGHYRTIAAVKPKNAKFLKGWLNRAYMLP